MHAALGDHTKAVIWFVIPLVPCSHLRFRRQVNPRRISTYGLTAFAEPTSTSVPCTICRDCESHQWATHWACMISWGPAMFPKSHGGDRNLGGLWQCRWPLIFCLALIIVENLTTVCLLFTFAVGLTLTSSSLGCPVACLWISDGASAVGPFFLETLLVLKEEPTALPPLYFKTPV